MQKASNITNKTPWKGANNNLDFGDNGVDAAGHLVQEGTSNGKKVYRAQDIWNLMNISRNGVHMIQTVKLYQD